MSKMPTVDDAGVAQTVARALCLEGDEVRAVSAEPDDDVLDDTVSAALGQLGAERRFEPLSREDRTAPAYDVSGVRH